MSSLFPRSLSPLALVESSLGLVDLLWRCFAAPMANSFGIDADSMWRSNGRLLSSVRLIKLPAHESYCVILQNLVDSDSLESIERISKSEQYQPRLALT
jgi:hypothetical protein